MKSESNAHILSSLRMFTNAASLIVISASLMVLTGWFLSIPSLKSFLPGLPAMRFNAALSLLRQHLGQALVSLVLLLNLLTLSEYLFGWTLGIDEFFVQDLDSLPDLFPGRIAPLAILCAGLCGLGLLGSRSARYFCYLAATLSFLIILNNLLDFQLLFRNSESSVVPAHTGAAFLVVSLAISPRVRHPS